MSKIIALSEATSIAIHSMILITNSKGNLNVAHIAEITNSSRHHVAKVLQRLVKEGFLESNRGPSGGFQLKMHPEDISLLQIFEAIEGKIQENSCLSNNTICPFTICLMGNIISNINIQFKDYFGNQKLSDYKLKFNVDDLIHVAEAGISVNG
ncbi:MAG: Rrf2 family transcriptional regulator [Bacteroidota bacterium]|nr:Rrf2 family transcriptional regulator [Bacteroidota bacterium]